MKLFYDTEFIEGTQRKRILGIPYGKTLPTIELISIGITDDFGLKYYEICKDFNLEEAWNRYDKVEQSPYIATLPEYKKVYWIRKNVLFPIFQYLSDKEHEEIKFRNNGTYIVSTSFTYMNLKRLLDKYGKTKSEIAADIKKLTEVDRNEPTTLHGYYSAYDHVVLCWLFGKMKNLHKTVPMYTNDVKQDLDKVVKLYSNKHKIPFDKALKEIKLYPDFPVNNDEHSAISDAIWTKELYYFVNKLAIELSVKD